MDFYTFNKHSDKEENNYLKFVYNHFKCLYGHVHVKHNPINERDKFYSNLTDKRMKVNFAKGKEYNEDLVNKRFQSFLNNDYKQKNELARLIKMITLLELFYGRYLSDTRIMFEEADNNNSFIASI
jgi:hypothetical protein